MLRTSNLLRTPTPSLQDNAISDGVCFLQNLVEQRPDDGTFQVYCGKLNGFD